MNPFADRSTDARQQFQGIDSTSLMGRDCWGVWIFYRVIGYDPGHLRHRLLAQSPSAFASVTGEPPSCEGPREKEPGVVSLRKWLGGGPEFVGG